MPVCKKEYEYICLPNFSFINFDWPPDGPFMKCYLFFLLPVFYFVSTAPLYAQETKEIQHSWTLDFQLSGKDSLFNMEGLKLQNQFETEKAANSYLVQLPGILYDQGYLSASIDSIHADSAKKIIYIFPGKRYEWFEISADSIERPALDAIRFLPRNFSGKPVNPHQWNILQKRLLRYYSNNGYPFARVYPDSIRILEQKVQVQLRVEKGIFYPIDSIRILGKAKLKSHFLQRYLSIENGSAYNLNRLNDVDRRIRELPYVNAVQPSNLTMLGTGAVLNLYLEPKRSSQVNFLIGFLPASGNDKKFQLTGDVNLDLKNMLGSGESILIKWQQLQVKSPRLNLGYNHPYIFNSSFGLDFLFDLFKKDSSFLQVNAQVGADYLISQKQWARIFVQWQSSSLLEGGIDTNLIKQTKQLPPNIDVKSTNLGLSYMLQNTNYRYNPRKGTELNLNATVGVKNISRNNNIVNLKDPNFDYSSLYDSVKSRVYQLRATVSGSHYFPIGKLSAIRAGLQAGIYSSPTVFRNDLFQIGGSKTLRGFDEESIYANQFAVVTAEYRNLLSLNSYLFFFADLGITKTKYQQTDVSNRFVGLGLGLVYETKVGLLNITYAMGMRNDIPFNIRGASKLHFGYVNYF